MGQVKAPRRSGYDDDEEVKPRRHVDVCNLDGKNSWFDETDRQLTTHFFNSRLITGFLDVFSMQHA